MFNSGIPEIDAFMEAEMELIAEESSVEEQAQLFRILHNGLRTIVLAQLQLPSTEDETASDRVKRRIKVIKKYLEKSNAEIKDLL